MAIKTTTTFVTKDLGFNKILRASKQMAKSYVLVGLPGARSPQAKNHDGTPARMTVAQLGVIHEFGSKVGNIPARPFMMQTNDNNRSGLRTKMRIATKNVTGGRWPAKKALGLLGNWYEGRIKDQIRSGTFVPLKPATIAKKGSSAPLIDTGQMRNSIVHLIKMRG